MNKQFTASEVREHAELMRTSQHNLSPHTPTMLRAYADLLEAQERAVPVAYALFTEKGLIRMWSREWFADAHGAPVNPTPLYTHPSPADAERLAKALERTARHRAAADRIDPDQWRSVLYSWEDRALAAHSARAQPASVAYGFASWGDWLESLTDDELVTIFYHYPHAANRMERLLAATPQPAKESDR